MFDPKTVSLVVFILAYVFFVIFPHRRSITAVVAAVLVMAFQIVTPAEAFGFVNWNVMGIFFGMLVLAEMLMQSNMPAVIAEILVIKAPRAWMAMLLICALASFISMFAENVATVLLIAPIAIVTAKKLKISPVMLLIGVAISSNLQGTATLIGDPPSMLLAKEMKMSFNDFIFYKDTGKISIFFFVQFGALVSLGVLYFFYRRHKHAVEIERHEKIQSWIPAIFMGTFILALVFGSYIDKGFIWFAGTSCMVWAAAGFIWHTGKYGKAFKFVKSFDWDTTFFLMGVFVLVGTMTHVEWIASITDGIQSITMGSKAGTFFVIVLASVLVSAFVDNVPYLATMLPVAAKLAADLEVSPEFLMFGLLIAACIGGNITPIGASANIVTVGYLRRHGYPVTFLQFMKLGIPFTIAATAAASALLWIVWG